MSTTSSTTTSPTFNAATVTKLNVKGTASSNAYITADTSYNMYFVANGLSLLSLDGSQKAVRSGSGYASQISLGTSSVRWSNLYSVAGNFSGNITASGGINYNGSEITNVNRITFAAGDAGRKTVITNGGSFLLYAATGGWAGGLGYYSNDGSSYLGNAAGAYGGGNTINYFYYGGSYSSPKMVISPAGNVGIGVTAASYKLHVSGSIYSTSGFVKSGSSNSYVLLGGGGHKALTDFAKGNVTINSGTAGRLAYYSSASTIDDYSSKVGDTYKPIYMNNGIPTICGFMPIGSGSVNRNGTKISFACYRFGPIVAIYIYISGSSNLGYGTFTLSSSLPNCAT